jgi:hypothetical protein
VSLAGLQQSQKLQQQTLRQKQRVLGRLLLRELVQMLERQLLGIGQQ